MEKWFIFRYIIDIVDDDDHDDDDDNEVVCDDDDDDDEEVPHSKIAYLNES